MNTQILEHAASKTVVRPAIALLPWGNVWKTSLTKLESLSKNSSGVYRELDVRICGCLKARWRAHRIDLHVGSNPGTCSPQTWAQRRDGMFIACSSGLSRVVPHDGQSLRANCKSGVR